MRFNIWPCHEFEIQTPFEPNRVLSIIASEIASTPSGITFRILKYYQKDMGYFAGQIDGNSFKLRRAISYRNSFLPQIEGAVSPDVSGSTVRIRMRLHPLISVFLTFWMVFTILAFVGFATSEFLKQGHLQYDVLGPLGMLAAATIVVQSGFWVEAKKQEADLNKMLRP